jgi:hypothetical protein
MADVRDEILKKILDSFVVREDGSINVEKGFECVRYTPILLSEVMSNDKLNRRLNSLRYLFPTQDDMSALSSPLSKIFKEMKEGDKFTFSEFEKKVKLMLKDVENYKIEPYEIYYSLNLEFEDKIETIKFKDVSIEIKDYEEIKEKISKILENEKVKNDLKFKSFKADKFKYAKVKIWARNVYYAEQVSTKYLELLLGFLVYLKNYQKVTYRLWGFPKERCKLELLCSFPFREETFLLPIYYKENLDSNEFEKINKSELESLNNLVKAFNSFSANRQDVVYKSVLLFYHGMTEKMLEYSFLNFWRSLEVIMLVSRNTPHADIVKILKFVIKNLTDFEKYEIDRLYALRNSLVHGAECNILQEDINLLKLYAELMVNFFLFYLPPEYNVKEIKAIYKFFKEEDKQFLEKSKSLIDFVINLDKGDSK